MNDPGDENDFRGHPNLSPEVNANILNSIIEGGAHIDKLPAHKRGYKVTTRNSIYELLRTPSGGWVLTQTPRSAVGYPLGPLLCNIHGSTWGGSMIRTGFIGRGMRLELGYHDGTPQVLLTSTIEEVEEI